MHRVRMIYAEAERIGIAFAFHALGAARGEFIEIVEVARELREPLEELAHAGRIADVRLFLERDEDEAQAERLPGAIVQEDLHGVFEKADAAFQPGAVFSPVGVGFAFLRVFEPAHHRAQPDAHEFAQPRDRVEREEDAQEDEEQPIHGWEYIPAHGAVDSG